MRKSKKILINKILNIKNIVQQRIAIIKDLKKYELENLDLKRKLSLAEENNTYLSSELIKIGYIPLFVSHGFNNLGDMLNYFLIEKLGYRYFRASLENCKLAMIGSILDQYFIQDNILNNEPVHVWGSGFIKDLELNNSRKKEKFIRPVVIHALRGELSRERCEKILSTKLDNIVLGDPGLLAPLLIGKKNINKKYDVGIIPHYIDKNNEHLSNIKLKNHTSTIIDVTEDTIGVIKKIAECRAVVSSSLHGLIVADSFNIPNKWIEFSDKVYGNGYKFRDYYSAFNLYNPKPINLRSETIKDEDVQRIIDNYKIKKSQVDVISKKLINSFPKKIFR